MSLQNRVDPWGRIVESAARGTFMGNRGGCMHDAQRRLVRPWAGKAWITCQLAFKDYRRPGLMTPGLYTELFFLDEATALAAGHRPCAECRRADFTRFKAAFAAGRAAADGAEEIRTAPQMDAVLHGERLASAGGGWAGGIPSRADTPTLPAEPLARASELPDGVMVEWEGGAWLKLGAGLRPWSFEGYGAARAAPDEAVEVLTPASTVAAIGRGYGVGVHESARAGGSG